VGWDPSITAREFKYLVEYAGMSPGSAILAGTACAADLLGIPSLGRIFVGSPADLVVVRGNPLSDIGLLETGVAFVMKGGAIVRHEV
jgi:imidazolonepropionase-like amidohydrolase